MALILADRVKETSTTAGNGVFTLDGAATGFQSFAIVGNGNTTYYCIAGQGTNEWEVGIGTYASAGATLTRTTVLSNSSATEPTALVFAAGTKDVFVTYPSEKSVNLDASGNATALGTPVAFTGTNITGTAAGQQVPVEPGQGPRRARVLQVGLRQRRCPRRRTGLRAAARRPGHPGRGLLGPELHVLKAGYNPRSTVRPASGVIQRPRRMARAS